MNLDELNQIVSEMIEKINNDLQLSSPRRLFIPFDDESPEGTVSVLKRREDGSLSIKGQLVRFNGKTWEPM